MTTRQEQKQQTRQALMHAALEWVEAGRQFSSLSIREVAKGAGVVPTAFYRHFRDLDDLALNLVDELSLVLRQLMRDVRQNRVDPLHIIRDSVELYCQYVVEHGVYFQFMSQSLNAGTAVVRQAMRSELQYFAKELVVDLQRLQLFPNLDAVMLDVLAEQTISTMAFATVYLLEPGVGQEAVRKDYEQRLTRQLQLIYLGAAHWHAALE